MWSIGYWLDVLGPEFQLYAFSILFLHEKNGPIKEFLSDSNPAIYRETHISEYVAHYTSKGLDGNSTLYSF